MNCLQCEHEMNKSLVSLYHYKESGLNHVYLKDSAAIYKCSCGEQLIEIPTIERLNDAISYAILTKKSLLAPTEFRFLRKWIRLAIRNRQLSMPGREPKHALAGSTHASPSNPLEGR